MALFVVRGTGIRQDRDPALLDPPPGRVGLGPQATRRATPWSQLATESRLRIEWALLARTRNVA